MARQPAAPKIPCPMSGKRGVAWGGYDQCEHCGKMVFIADRDSRYAKHNLPAEMARDEIARRSEKAPPVSSAEFFALVTKNWR